MKAHDEIYELGKKDIGYDRHLAIVGKEKADNVLYFWMKGYKRANRSIIELEKERFEWSLKTFPEATAISSLRKLEEEINEIEVDIASGRRIPVEYADALMCLFDSAGRHGIAAEAIFEAFEMKLAENKARTWKKNADNTYSHVKTEEAPKCDYPLHNHQVKVVGKCKKCDMQSEQ